MSRDRRARRDRPYLDEHLASARPRSPRTFGELLVWFLEGFSAETPERIHSPGVWSTTRRLDARAQPIDADIGLYDPASGRLIADASALSGGSQLGAPRNAEPFRQLLENSARQWTDERGTVDPYYVRPMRAALARMAGHTDGSDSAFMARFLLQVAYAGGDWEAVASRWAIQPYLRRIYVETALRRLHNAWRPDPPMTGPTWVDYSESTRHAIEAGEAGETNGGTAA